MIRLRTEQWETLSGRELAQVKGASLPLPKAGESCVSYIKALEVWAPRRGSGLGGPSAKSFPLAENTRAQGRLYLVLFNQKRLLRVLSLSLSLLHTFSETWINLSCFLHETSFSTPMGSVPLPLLLPLAHMSCWTEHQLFRASLLGLPF